MSGLLPKAWVNSKLEDVVDTIVGGGTPSKAISSYFQGDIPWMSVKDMNKNELVDTVDHISQEAVENSSTNVIPAGTPIVATRMSLGKIVTASFDSAINQDLKALFVNLNIEKPYFVYWYRSISNLIESLGTGTTVKGIRLEVLRGLDLPFPPLAEQKVIADKLDELLAQVESTKARLDAIPAILKSFRQSVLAAAVSGKLTEEWRLTQSSVETEEASLKRILQARESEWNLKGKYKAPENVAEFELSTLPKSWSLSSLDMVTDGNKPICYGILMPKENFKNGVLYVKVRDMKNNLIQLSGLQRTSPEIAAKYARSTLSQGDILVSIRGTYGKVVVVPKELDGGNITQDSARVSTCDLVERDYILYTLRAPVIQKYFQAVARGVAVRGVNIGDLKPTPIPLPPKGEQTEIVRRVKGLLTFADKVEAQVNEAQTRVNNLTQSILAKAFRGEFTADWRAANPSLITGDNSAEALLERIKVEREALAKTTKAAKKKSVKKVSSKKDTTKKVQDTTIDENLSPVESVIADGIAHKPQDIFDKLTPDLSMTEVFNEISKLLSDNKIEEKTVDGITGFFITS